MGQVVLVVLRGGRGSGAVSSTPRHGWCASSGVCFCRGMLLQRTGEEEDVRARKGGQEVPTARMERVRTGLRIF